MNTGSGKTCSEWFDSSDSSPMIGVTWTERGLRREIESGDSNKIFSSPEEKSKEERQGSKMKGEYGRQDSKIVTERKEIHNDV